MLELRKKQASKSIISIHTSTGLQIIVYKLPEKSLRAKNGERKDRIYMGQNADYRMYNYSKYKTYAMVEDYLKQVVDACLHDMSDLASMRKVKTKTSSCESLHDVFKTVTDLEDKIKSLEAVIDKLEKDNKELIERNAILDYKLGEATL